MPRPFGVTPCPRPNAQCRPLAPCTHRFDMVAALGAQAPLSGARTGPASPWSATRAMPALSLHSDGGPRLSERDVSQPLRARLALRAAVHAVRDVHADHAPGRAHAMRRLQRGVACARAPRV
jgi:hypothetical protein